MSSSGAARGGATDASVAALITTPSATQAAADGRYAGMDDAAINALRHGAKGDGVADDTAALHAARDAAGVGRVVQVPKGVYVVSGLVLNVAGQRWRLDGGASIVMKAGTAGDVVTLGAAGVAVEGGTIDGNRAAGGNGRGVVASGVSGVCVRGVTVQNTAAEGISLSGCSDVVIDANTLANCAAAGNKKAIIMDAAAGSYARVRVTGNLIDGTGQGNGGIQVISVTAGNTARDLVVSGNVIAVGDNVGADTLGIELYSNTGGVIIGAVIASNTIQAPGAGTRAFGISVGGIATAAGLGNSDVAVVGNSVRNCRGPAVELIGRGLSCIGNTFDTCGRISAASNDVAGDMTGVVIVGNILRNSVDANYAIQLQATAVNAQRGTICAHNLIEGCVGEAIAISGNFYDGQVVNNVLRGVALYGIDVRAAAVVSGTRITGNRMDLTGGAANKAGIIVASAAAADLVIDNNVITGPSQYGIFCSAAVNRVSIRSNEITGCGSNGIMLAGGDRFVIANNHVHDNTGRGISLSGAPTNTTLGENVAYNNTGGDVVTGGTFAPMTLGGTQAGGSPAAGGAGALPATPAGYLTVAINGTNRQIAYY